MMVKQFEVTLEICLSTLIGYTCSKKRRDVVPSSIQFLRHMYIACMHTASSQELVSSTVSLLWCGFTKQNIKRIDWAVAVFVSQAACTFKAA